MTRAIIVAAVRSATTTTTRSMMAGGGHRCRWFVTSSVPTLTPASSKVDYDHFTDGWSNVVTSSDGKNSIQTFNKISEKVT